MSMSSRATLRLVAATTLVFVQVTMFARGEQAELFVRLTGTQCAEELSFGEDTVESIATSTGYLSTLYKDAYHSVWTQYVDSDGDGTDEMRIIWAFDTSMSVAQRIADAVAEGVAVTWYIFSDQSNVEDGSTPDATVTGTWWFSDSADVTEKTFDLIGTRFSADDGCWGAPLISGDPVNGNDGGNVGYGICNYNNVDSASCSQYYVRGSVVSSSSNLRSYVYVGEHTFSPTPSPSMEPSSSPTASAFPTASPNPTVWPTAKPSSAPTAEPTPAPTSTWAPTSAPTSTAAPTNTDGLVIDVTNFTDSLTGSCRAKDDGSEACNVRAAFGFCAARSDVSNCTIVLAAGTHTLTHGSMPWPSHRVHLTIEGEVGAEPAIVDGRNNTDRWLTGVGSQVQLSMMHMVVRNFHNAGDGDIANVGGAVLLVGMGGVELRNVRMESNGASRGGALYVMNSTRVTVSNSSWADNSASVEGGAVMVNASDGAVFTNCSWTRNIAAAKHGGALSVRTSGHASFHDCAWRQNSAAENGGAVQLSASPSSAFSGCTWSGNSASERGGGLSMIASDDSVLSNCTWVENDSGSKGGGLYLSDTDKGVFDESVWLSNFAADGGGAVYMALSRETTFINCTYAENIAKYGAVFMTTAYSSAFKGCRWRANTARTKGGGTYLVTSDGSRFEQCEWQENTVSSGEGGALYLSSDNLVLANSTWDGNVASTSGGAVYVYYGHNIEFVNTEWRGNAAVAEDGGALFLSNSQNADLSNCVWENNSAKAGGGGAVYIRGSDNSVFTDCVWFANSVDEGGGGAVYVSSAESSAFDNCSWEQNRAAHGDGGAVVLDAATNAQFRNGFWTNNSAANGGANVYLVSSRSCAFHASRWVNTSCAQGSALFMDRDNSGIVMSNSTFANLHASDSGAVLYLNQDNDNIQLRDSEAFGNSAAVDGAVMYLRSDNSDVLISGCTMWGNRAAQGAVVSSVLATTRSVIRHSVMTENRASSGGALSFGQDDEWLVAGCRISNNRAGVLGGAMEIDDAEMVVITDSIIRDNRAASGPGGGLLVSGEGTTVIADTTIADNSADTEGGGLRVQSSSLFMTNCTVSGNVVPLGNGGGVYIDTHSRVQLGFVPIPLAFAIQEGFLNVSGSLLNFSQSGRVNIHANRASGSGGGIYASDTALILVETSFRKNVAAGGSGGGMGLGPHSFVLDLNASVYDSNVASESGGGIFVDNDAHITMHSSAFIGNNASHGGGGGVFVEELGEIVVQRRADEDDESAVSGSTLLVASNYAQTEGGGMLLRSPDHSFDTAVEVANNTAGDGGGGLFWDWQAIPLSVDTANMSFSGNEAAYGPDAATAIFNVTAPSHTRAASGSSVPVINLTAIDYYSHVVSVYDSNFAQASVNVGAASACSNPKLSGSSVANFVGGVATFSDLAVTCEPDSAARLTFSVQDADLGVSFEAQASLELEPCHFGQIVRSQDCVTCTSGAYTWSNNASSCKDCLEHSTCPESSGWQVDVDRGYWRGTNFSTRVRWCPASAACEGGTVATDDQCSTGSSGPLCLVCEPGYYKPSSLSKCDKCDSGSRWAPILVIVGVLLCVAAAGAWIYYRKHEWIDAFLKAYAHVSFRVSKKILFAYVQVVAQYRVIFSVSYPSSYTATSSALNMANLGFSTLFAPHCYNSHYDFYDTLVLQTAGALVLVLLGCVLCGVRHALTKSSEGRAQLWIAAFRYFIVFTYVVFPGTSTTIFQAFSCDDDFDGSQSYLKADYSISCNSQRYRSFVVYAAVMVLVFPVGIMALYTYVLWTHRHQICPSLDSLTASAESDAGDSVTDTGGPFAQFRKYIAEHEALIASTPQHPDTKQTHALTTEQAKRAMQYEARSHDPSLAPIGLLVVAYRPELWWMEILECARRLLMSSALVFFWPATATQIIVAMLIGVVFLLFYSWMKPCMHERSNKLMTAVLWSLLFQLFLALLLFEDLIGSDVLASFLLLSVMIAGPLVPLLTDAWREGREAVMRSSSTGSMGSAAIAMRQVRTAVQSGGAGGGDGEDVVTPNPLTNDNLEL